MAEYINREAVKKKLELKIKSWSRDCNSKVPAIVNTYKEILHELKYIPTADVVEVVRCKDCKYCNKYAKWNGTDYYGCNFNVADIYEIEPTHFCSCGERKGVKKKK